MRRHDYWVVRDGQLGTGHLSRDARVVDFKPATYRYAAEPCDALSAIATRGGRGRGERSFPSEPLRLLCCKPTISDLDLLLLPAAGVWLADLERPEKPRVHHAEFVRVVEPLPTAEVIGARELEVLNGWLEDEEFVETSLGLPRGVRARVEVQQSDLPLHLELEYADSVLYEVWGNVFHRRIGRFLLGITPQGWKEIMCCLIRNLFLPSFGTDAYLAQRLRSLDGRLTAEAAMHRWEQSIIRRTRALFRDRKVNELLVRWVTLHQSQAQVNALFVIERRELSHRCSEVGLDPEVEWDRALSTMRIEITRLMHRYRWDRECLVGK